MPATDDAAEELRARVARVLEAMETEGAAALERACAEQPAHAAALRERIDVLARLGFLAESPRAAAAMPERIGDFRLLRRIGGGGMGVVYLAEDLALGRRVALKLIRPELAWFAGSRERFRREVEAIARLSHPSIVPIHRVGAEGDLPWFAMEWIDGASLDAVLKVLERSDARTLDASALPRAIDEVVAEARARAGGDAPQSAAPEPLPAAPWDETCVRLVLQAAEAIDHAHQRGVIHRDLKPANLMLTRDGRVRVVDFGLASTSGASRLTASSSQIGSLPYMSPEHLERGAEAIDARSDVYSLGVTLYELLTLRHAFAESDAERLRRSILDAAFAPIRVVNPRVSWDAETVCLTAMEREPARRYATAAAFARDLRHVLASEPIEARRAGASVRLRRLVKRRPAQSVAAVLGALLVVVGPGVYAWEQRQRTLDLGAANAEIARQLAAANRAKRRAEDAAVLSRQAVTEFLSKVGDELLRSVPHGEPIRKELQDRAVSLYEKILADDPDNADVRIELANNVRTLANRCDEQGETERARLLYDRAIETLEPLRAGADAASPAQRALAAALGDRALAAFRRGEQDAPAAVRAAIEQQRKCCAAAPADAELARGLAGLLDCEGYALARADRKDEALRSSEEAVQLMDGLVRRDAASRDLETRWLMYRTTHADLLTMAGQAEDASDEYADLAAELEKRLAPDRRRADLRPVALRVAANQGHLLAHDLDRAADAEAPLRASVELARGLVADFPQQADLRFALAYGLDELAAALPAERRAEADVLLAEAERLLVALQAATKMELARERLEAVRARRAQFGAAH
jgi:serine/threonine protein kinase